MDRIIKLSISGRGAGTDAPTVDDLLDQVRDYFDIVREVEEAIAVDASSAIEWRIVAASTDSPVALEVAPFPREYGVNIDQRVEETIGSTAHGLQVLQTSAERPPFFTDRALEKAERFFGRVMNGLSLTEVDHGQSLPPLAVTPASAHAAARNAEAILEPPGARPHKEIGSVEGYVQRVEKDGYGRPLIRIRLRLTGATIKCVVQGRAREKIEKHQIEEVWRGRRIQVAGVIHYKAPGRVAHVMASDVRFFRERDELPDLRDIEDEEFTSGKRSEDYLEMIRDGGHP